MKNTIICCLSLFFLGWVQAQKRLTPPKAKSNIESVDQFVAAAFEIYNTTFDFHYGMVSEINAEDNQILGDADGEGETEIEDANEAEELSIAAAEPKDEFRILEENIKILMASVPQILEEIDSHSVARQVKATLSINRAIKALKQSGKMVKTQVVGR